MPTAVFDLPPPRFVLLSSEEIERVRELLNSNHG